MNKSELVESVAAKTGVSTAEARRHVEAVLHTIVASVAAGERVALTGFGSFESATRPGRTARNPRTGAAVDVPAGTVPRFRAGAAFRASVAAGDAPEVPAVVQRTASVRRRGRVDAADGTTAPEADGTVDGGARERQDGVSVKTLKKDVEKAARKAGVSKGKAKKTAKKVAAKVSDRKG
ncbi:HU family DNA-binding protein [Xylanimonas oleitrophica]|uniref:HU family DNA-binding protein n=1 Tax=Xylanimonas oleitrophica TaxID=2607479 RepID=UPI0015CFCAC0|nr:HU family DNA-binding protein [Xylanimonas oleitrophica]